jgi:hypothetical protein
LPAGKKIYFRGYATNASLTGYSQDGIFYTEPAVPASPNVTITGQTYNSFTITWVEGDRTDSYDGAIVVVRDTTEAKVDPVDGEQYIADPVFKGGDEVGTLGSSNYAVYAGPGNSVTVTDLWHNGWSDRTYSVAVYEYSGTGTEINYNLTPSEVQSAVMPYAPSHREAFNLECSQCHSHGGWGNYAPRDADQQDLCKTCHISGGEAAAKAAVFNHVGAGVTTDCGSCHEVHGSGTADELVTTDFRTSNTELNRNWVRGNPGTSYNPPYVPGAADAEPIIFHSASNEEFARPASDADLPGNSTGLLDGVCQTCHTNPGGGTTKYHTKPIPQRGATIIQGTIALPVTSIAVGSLPQSPRRTAWPRAATSNCRGTIARSSKPVPVRGTETSAETCFRTTSMTALILVASRL